MTRPCTCKYPDATDPCGHSDTSEGCPQHDPYYDERYGDEKERAMRKQPVVLIVDNPDDMTSVFTLGDVRIIEEDSYYSSRWADSEIEGSEREHVFALWERTAAELEDEWGPNDGADYLRDCAAEGRRRVEARRRYDDG